VKSGIYSIHAAVLLFGLAGLFAKWLTLSPISIVWWRSVFAMLALALAVIAARKKPFAVDRKTALVLIAMGGILAAHWVTFFAAIQMSTVAIGLLSFSTFPVIVALLEPLLPEERFRASSLAFAAVALGGVALVVPSFDLDSAPMRGAIVGVVSGVLYALTTVLNRAYVTRLDALTLGLWQNAVGCAVLIPFAPEVRIDPASLGLVAILGIVFTGGAHALFIHGMREVPARVASIIGTLEPVYGVAAAALLLHEVPTLRSLVGGGIIVIVVAFASRHAA
jgi:drug/metabolite transporter (DMT)-like permease